MSKLPIIAVLAYPFTNKYVVHVTRGDGKHLPSTRIYESPYSKTKSTYSLRDKFVTMNNLLSSKILLEKMEKYNND